MNDRPRCVSCRNELRHEEAGRAACVSCEQLVRRNLEELAGPGGLFAKLVWAGADALTPSSGRRSSGPVVRTSKTVAPPPVRMGVVNLLGAGGVVQTLQRWARSWFADLGFKDPMWRGQHEWVTLVSPDGRKVGRPGQLDYTVKALLNNLVWAADKRADFGKFASDVHRFVESSKDALDPTIEHHNKILIGRCPTLVGADRHPCGAQLLADPYATAIRCPGCETKWARADWVALGRTLRPNQN